MSIRRKTRTNSGLFLKSLIIAFTMVGAGVSFAAAAAVDDPPSLHETKAEQDARMQWFRDAKFGMFIHWGLYSQLAGEWQGQTVTGGAEWIQQYLGIPSSQYSSLVKTWNPTKFNAREWVRLMKAAGVKYICITTKHHDGFCLWPTKMNNDWNIKITPGGKDLLKPLAAACREEGVRFCIYHSVMDWHHPDWPKRPQFNDYAKGTPDKALFKAYLYGQLKELFSNYGSIGMVWFDGTWDREAWTSQDGKELEDYTRSLQPSVILDNRSGYVPPQPKLGFGVANSYGYVFAGDYISPEGEVPPTGLPGIDWETCQTMQLPNNWGYNRLVGFRSFEDLLHQLIDVTSKGGNMLLNIGPTAEGEILPQARRCLEKFAAWMKINKESIHGTTASPFEVLPFDGRCTQKPGKLYLQVFAWPKSGKLLVPVTNKVSRVYLLSNPREALVAVSSKRGVELSLPAVPPDPIASVVVVDIEGPAAVIAPPAPISQGMPVTVSAEWQGRDTLKKEHVNDGKTDTIWAGPENSREGWAQIDLGEERSVSRVLVSEGSEFKRCRKFSVQSEIDGQWKPVATGTSIGAQKQVVFEPVKARRFRLTVTVDKPAGMPDGEPVIAEFQLFGE
jgi:alpha-L-fucosidase